MTTIAKTTFRSTIQKNVMSGQLFKKKEGKCNENNLEMVKN